jgi:hypothetical protein
MVKKGEAGLGSEWRDQEKSKSMSVSSDDRVLQIPAVFIALLSTVAQTSAEGGDELYERAKVEKTLVLYGAGPARSHDR